MANTIGTSYDELGTMFTTNDNTMSIITLYNNLLYHLYLSKGEIKDRNLIQSEVVKVDFDLTTFTSVTHKEVSDITSLLTTRYRTILTLNLFIKYKQYIMCEIIYYILLLRGLDFQSINKILENLKNNNRDLLIFPDLPTTLHTSGGNAKVKKMAKKEILGRERCIYKKAGDRKEYLKHKGELITVKDYKKQMKVKK
jgi:hypothetical protein